jgi:hypothetical protein
LCIGRQLESAPTTSCATEAASKLKFTLIVSPNAVGVPDRKSPAAAPAPSSSAEGAIRYWRTLDVRAALGERHSN